MPDYSNNPVFAVDWNKLLFWGETENCGSDFTISIIWSRRGFTTSSFSTFELTLFRRLSRILLCFFST